MKFWDSSALIPLLVQERTSSRLIEFHRSDTVMLVWWAAEIECVSALARRERDDAAISSAIVAALRRLREYRAAWHIIPPVEAVKETAWRLLRVHPLRAADSLQLAAAILASENRPSSLDFVCLDKRLGAAAEREGFNVIDCA